jgi:hypothetical protein
MNLEQLKKNQGSAVHLRPVPVRFQTTQDIPSSIDDQWTIYNVEDRKVELHNLRTAHVVVLGSDNVREFRSPNFLLLRCQLTLTEEQVLIEPLVGGGRGPTSAPTPEHPTIRENSAAEILSHLKGTRLEFYERVDELYRGRWTRDPGWRVTVYELPSKLSSNVWFCSFEEFGSGTLVTVTTVQDVSALRLGDAVTVSGRISDVTQLGSVSLADAIVQGGDTP